VDFLIWWWTSKSMPHPAMWRIKELEEQMVRKKVLENTPGDWNKNISL
jgi:hypothetical protein